MDFSFDNLNYNSVENVPGFEARAAFTINSATVFKEDVDIVPTIIDDTLSYVPWGGDNQLPYNVIDLIERDETLSTCQVFNAEACFDSNQSYDTCLTSPTVFDFIENFTLDNDLATYFIGVPQDFKHFYFARNLDKFTFTNLTILLRTPKVVTTYFAGTLQPKYRIIVKLRLIPRWQPGPQSRDDDIQ